MQRHPASEQNQIRSREAGDTLVELLVSLAIISICVIGLIGGLTAAVSSSGTHRDLTNLDAAVKNFAELVRYEVQLQPASSPGTKPLFARCAAEYLVAGAPNPSSGPVGTAVTAFGSGFTAPSGSVSLTAPSGPTTVIPNAVTAPNGPYGNVTANFIVPALPAATYLLAINNGSGTATAPVGFTVTPWLGALSASSGPVGTFVTVPVTGFGASKSLTVTVGSATIPGAGTTNSSGSTRPGSPVGFTIPSGLPNGPVTVAVTDGTHTATATFTVGGAGAGPPGVASPVVSSSPLANYQVGISGINYWNGTTFPQPALTASQCLGTGHNPNQDIQQITISGAAPGATDQLNTVVANPQYVPTPAISTTLDAASSPQVGGQLVFDATVTGPPGDPTPTGNVNWQISASSGAAPNCSSTSNSGSGNSAIWTCTLQGSQLTASTYSVTAVYTGDTNYNTASSTIAAPVTVAPDQPTISVTAPSPTPTYGQAATFTATVSVPANAPAPTGQVTWNVSGPATSCDSTTPLTATPPYQATCTINHVTVGTYSVMATVAADPNYLTVTSTPPTTLTVPHIPTTTSVTASPPTVNVGGTIQLSATVTGGGPSGSPPLTGTVTWPGVTCASQSSNINGTTGTWTCDVVAATAGSYTATANYGSDPAYKNSSGTSPPVQVNPVTPSVTVTPTFSGGTLTFTATVAGPPGGATPTESNTASWTLSGPNGLTTCSSVTALTGSGNPQGTATATCAVTRAASGSYAVMYSYNGDGNYTASNGSTSYTVPQATPAVGISAALHRGTLTFTATVTGPAGGPTPTGTGTWTVAGPGGVSVCGSTTALTGTGNPPGTATATCVFANHPAPGSYTLTYAYNGDGNYNPARAGPTTFQIPRFVVTSALAGGTLTFTATLTIGTASPPPSGRVTWAVTGGATSCTGGTTALTGAGTTYRATCKISNASGSRTYNATAGFVGDAYYLAADDAETGVRG